MYAAYQTVFTGTIMTNIKIIAFTHNSILMAIKADSLLCARNDESKKLRAFLNATPWGLFTKPNVFSLVAYLQTLAL